jgi:hypothetical protein
MYLESDAFHYIPDIRKLGITDITEDEFYKLIGLTDEEIYQIKNPSSSLVANKDEMENEIKPKIKKIKNTKSKKLIIEE